MDLDSFLSRKEWNEVKSNAEIQNSLRNEILQLEKRLPDQVAVRGALEQAFGYRSSCRNLTNQASIPKPATELIKEIAVFEYEVSHLEQYLLSLYRKAFDQQISCPNDDSSKSSFITARGKYVETCRNDISLKLQESNNNGALKEEDEEEDIVLDYGVHRCHSSQSHHSIENPVNTLGKDLCACHSQPLSMMELLDKRFNNATTFLLSMKESVTQRSLRSLEVCSQA
ncbi:hypothetical protein L1887_30186 [Cichorium endivia]|nr:hypothetical protein L1887_30186 [Cichorium endivia]